MNDIDIYMRGNAEMVVGGKKTLIVMTQHEPTYAQDIIHHSIVDEGMNKPVGIVLSKFLSETTLNILPNPDEVGSKIYELNPSLYYLSIPRWRRINPTDPTADWIYTYPICKGICDWANKHGFTQLIALGVNSIHHFLEGGDYAKLSNRKVYQWEHPKTIYDQKGSWLSKKHDGEVLFTPMEYNLPLLFSETSPLGGQGLSVFTGSKGIAEVDFTSAKTLIKYLNKISPSLISKEAEENAQHTITRQIAEDPDQVFIRDGDEPNNANGSVMFG